MKLAIMVLQTAYLLTNSTIQIWNEGTESTGTEFADKQEIYGTLTRDRQWAAPPTFLLSQRDFGFVEMVMGQIQHPENK